MGISFGDKLLLKAFVTGKSKADIIAGNYELSDSETRNLAKYEERVGAGYPVAYILEEKEFYGRLFKITPDVLIPRPETESLVEEILKLADERFTSGKTGLRILDLGTGSGILGITLGREISDRNKDLKLELVLVDKSKQALEVALSNANTHLAEYNNIQWTCVESDLLNNVSGQFDIIASNLPYIETPQLDDGSLATIKYEPRPALDGGQDGLDLYRRLADHLLIYKSGKSTNKLQITKGRLTESGFILGLECDPGQVGELGKIFGEYKNIRIFKDQAMIERGLLISESPAAPGVEGDY